MQMAGFFKFHLIERGPERINTILRDSQQQACLEIWTVNKSISGNETDSWYQVAIDKKTRNVPLISMRQLTRIFP